MSKEERIRHLVSLTAAFARGSGEKNQPANDIAAKAIQALEKIENYAESRKRPLAARQGPYR